MALEADIPVGSQRLRLVKVGPVPALLHKIYSITFIVVFSAKKGDIGLEMGMDFNDFLLILNT